MTAYIVRRLILAMVVIFLVTLLVFFMMRLLPGDPLDLYLSQTQNLATMDPKVLADLRHEFGLDQPLPMQYINWILGTVHGEFGTSIYYRDSVASILAQYYPVTIQLGVVALLLSSVVGILVGIVAALKRGKWTDNLVTILSYFGIAVPVFWLGILLILLFGTKLHWLPTSGYVSPFDNFWLNLRQIIMPVFCLALFSMAATMRQMRSSMLEVIQQDYIRTAISKGLGQYNVVFKHALKNSLIPVITLIGMQVRAIFGGSILIETVFAIPGVGRLLVSSILGHDYVVVQSIALVIAVIVVICNLVVDLVYGWIDPRIRYS